MTTHPEFPGVTYGYVAFRADKADAVRFGRHLYSTPLHNLREMRRRQETLAQNPQAASPILVARFELVNVESWALNR